MIKNLMFEENNKDDVVERASHFVCPDRVSTFKQLGAVPVIARREGNYFWDMDGRKLFDVHINGGTYNLGHRNPVRRDAGGLEDDAVVGVFVGKEPRVIRGEEHDGQKKGGNR